MVNTIGCFFTVNILRRHRPTATKAAVVNLAVVNLVACQAKVTQMTHGAATSRCFCYSGVCWLAVAYARYVCRS